MAKPISTKISQVWWHTPIVLATQEAEVGGSPEPTAEVEAKDHLDQGGEGQDHATPLQP